MARTALRWSAADLAKAAGAGYATVARFETGERVNDASVAKLREAFEREGVVFIQRGVYVGGVVPPMEER
jgi:transcriptional regulator with XRE-family HTH domain